MAPATGLFELLLILGLAGIWGLHRERAARWVLAPVLPIYLLTALAMPLLIPGGAHAGIFTRLSEGAPSCASRTTLWLNVLDLIRLEPWWGWGWGWDEESGCGSGAGCGCGPDEESGCRSDAAAAPTAVGVDGRGVNSTPSVARR